jgi:hypothetical protein
MSLNDLGDAVMLNECLNAPHFLQPPTDKSSPLPLHQEPPPCKTCVNQHKSNNCAKESFCFLEVPAECGWVNGQQSHCD